MSDHATEQSTPNLSLPEWGPGKTPRGRARLPSTRRREKTQLSCNLCRQRKLKCDRQHPCTSCNKRALGSFCTYPSSATGEVTKEQPPATMQDRINHLEKLVVHMMQGNYNSPEDLPVSATQIPGTGLQLVSPERNTIIPDDPNSFKESTSHSVSKTVSIHVTRTGASYVTDAHWAAVLDGIAEIKNHFETEEQLANEQAPDLGHHGRTEPLPLFGCFQLATREEILASLPPRPLVDQLVSSYFSSFEMSPAVLHSVEFLKEYEKFWNNQSTTPIIWIGLLFTILCLATQFRKYKLEPSIQSTSGQTNEGYLQTTVESLRQAAVQCLLSGNYVNGGPYVLETLMLYFTVEHFLSNDAEPGIWILLGTIIQIAMRMGYHRDPKHYEGMTPFCGEMQRRIWATIVALDLIISAQMGLPRLIKQWQTDTAEPLSLEDRDFDKTTTNMPPSRPESDFIPMLFRIVNARMVKAMGAVWDFATDIRTYTYDDVMRIDEQLETAHASIPQCLRWSFSGLADSPQVFMQKMSLESVYHRAKIVLHRKYLRMSMRAQHAESWKICLESALKLLEYQNILQEKTEIFGQLYQDRWRVTSLVKHDFLLASSILCSYLQQGGQNLEDQSIDSTIRSALRRSYDIWLLSSSESKEARKAASALSVVLGISDSIRSNRFPTGSQALSGLPWLPSYDNFGHYQGSNTGFNVLFPGSDATTWTDWSGPSAVDPLFSDHVPDRQAHALDGVANTTGTFQWPWNG
ncbi:fungal-specific transcription factor domain-containing protein [Phaeosphaeriaceae sp. PMI808]|nr:fungal-specific transcription factor domain-containing protein [Phaeosphaeriaceae sp. PMI808]